MVVITFSTTAVGLAGQYRRRIHKVTREHGQKLRDQARALSQRPHCVSRYLGRVTEWNEGSEADVRLDERRGRRLRFARAPQNAIPLFAGQNS